MNNGLISIRLSSKTLMSKYEELNSKSLVIGHIELHSSSWGEDCGVRIKKIIFVDENKKRATYKGKYSFHGVKAFLERIMQT